MYTVLLRTEVDNPNKPNLFDSREIARESNIQVIADRYTITDKDYYKFYKKSKEVARIYKLDVIAILAE